MPITIQCPTCQAAAAVSETISGKSVKCKKCGTPFKAVPTLDGEKNDTKRNFSATAESPFLALPAEFGRYRVLKKLGQGGMGAVYLAQDTQLGRQVALKLPSFATGESFKRGERFVREARSSAVLHHPNICTVFDAGEQDGRPFLSMAYIEGRPLEDAIDPASPLDPHRAATLARKIALALAHAHAKGIVHRDLKPANVMLAEGDEPVVMDFGLAKRIDEADADEANADEAKLTRDGAVMGTPSYMAPEQVRGEINCIGPATDVYALGVMLFEMLTGRTPYRGALGMVMGQILTAPVPAVSDFRPGVDPRLEAICRKAMAKEIRDRFAVMADLASGLDEFLRPPVSSTAGAASDRTPTPANVFAGIDAVTTEVEPAQRSTPKAKVQKRKKKPASKLPYLIGGVVLGVLVLLGLVLTVKTKHGEVVIELNDPAANVAVQVDGERIELTGLDKPLSLTAGEHGLTVSGPDFETVTQQFTVKKGEKTPVRVTMKPKAPLAKRPEPKANGPKANPAKEASKAKEVAAAVSVPVASSGSWPELLTKPWNEPPIDPTWNQVEPETISEVAKAKGMIERRFAFVQDLPYSRMIFLSDSLTKSGYRPVRIRVFLSRSGRRVAAIWTRDGGGWKLEAELTPREMRETGQKLKREMYFYEDLGCHPAEEWEDGIKNMPGDIKSYALFGRREISIDQAIIVGIAEKEFDKEWRQLMDRGFVPLTRQHIGVGAKGIHSGIWIAERVPWEFWHDMRKGNFRQKLMTFDKNLTDIGIKAKGDSIRLGSLEACSALGGSPWPLLIIEVTGESFATPLFHFVARFEADFEQRRLDSMTPEEHLRAARGLTSSGFRPLSLSVVEPFPDGPLTISAIWNRPK